MITKERARDFLSVVSREDVTPQLILSFEILREQIVNSSDRNRNNYTKENMNLSEQEEVVFLLKYNTIVSFSTLYCRPTFPPGTSRVLNRMWKSSEVRSLGVPYWLFSRPMLLTQIKMAKKLGKKAVFLSTEGRRRLWLKRWLKEAIKDHKEWTLMSGMRQVCLGNKRECWQNVAYLPLENHYNFHLPEITMKQWEELESSKL